MPAINGRGLSKIMIKRAIVFTVGAAVLALSPLSGNAAELLLDGTFESPAQSGNGNHQGAVPDSWIVAEDATTTTTTNVNDSNLNRGVVTNGVGITGPSQYLGICPDDPNGQQSLDGAGKLVYVSQAFTLSTTSPLAIAIDFGGRDSGSSSGTGASWQLLNGTGTVVASTSGITPATGAWVKTSVVTNALPSGNYRFVVALPDPDMIDAATITTVPEPSTLAAAGLGVSLLGWVGFKRRRKS